MENEGIGLFLPWAKRAVAATPLSLIPLLGIMQTTASQIILLRLAYCTHPIHPRRMLHIYHIYQFTLMKIRALSWTKSSMQYDTKRFY